NSSVELLAAQFSVTSDMLNDLQEKQRIILHYDDHGNLQKYE
ncbi:poly-beta-1,6-N-acetyl-D-glucosamine biosynthesis protein PgaD, partial [Acinetobacter nosocomialis]